MGLKIVHDGSKPGDVQENCCMCRAPTRWWWGTGARNVALCPECAKTTKVSELPTKEAWCAKERKLNPAFRNILWKAPKPVKVSTRIFVWNRHAY